MNPMEREQETWEGLAGERNGMQFTERGREY